MGSPAETLGIEIDPERLAEWLAQDTGDATPHNAAPHNAAPHNAAPHNAAPHNAAPHNAAPQAPQVIDVREPYEREAGHIAGTRHIPLTELTSQAATVERERPVVFYCRVGARSDMAAQAFRAAGYEAYSMSGGLVRWAREGRPLAPEGGHVANH